jgi:RNA polymerase-binding transcription factor DksA
VTTSKKSVKSARSVKSVKSAKSVKSVKSGGAAKSAHKPKKKTDGKAVRAATAAAVLGIPVTPAKRNSAPVDIRGKTRAEWVKYQTNLLALRDRLLDQMDGLAKESAEQMAGYSLHMADSGTDNFDRDFALSLLSSDQDAIYEIEEALRRIQKGTYGLCELTGKTIPRARLDAIPWTRFTVEAQSQLEREGALRQKRLGSLGTVDSTGAVEIDDDDDSDDNKPAKEKD